MLVNARKQGGENVSNFGPALMAYDRPIFSFPCLYSREI